MKKRMYYAPDGAPDQPETPEQETTPPEIHTEKEVELEKKITELTTQVTQLVEENRKLYLKLSGTNGEPEQKSIDELLNDQILEWGRSGFNPEKLCN